MWQPIETAPKDNKRPLWLARFNDDGTMQSFDYNGSWESESESWEMPEVYYFWASENGNVEEPSHWAYQPEGFCVLLGAQPAPEKLCYDSRWEISIDYVDGWNAAIDAVRGKSPSWYCPDCCIVFPFGEPKSCPHDDARCNRALTAAPEAKS